MKLGRNSARGRIALMRSIADDDLEAMTPVVRPQFSSAIIPENRKGKPTT